MHLHQSTNASHYYRFSKSIFCHFVFVFFSFLFIVSCIGYSRLDIYYPLQFKKDSSKRIKFSQRQTTSICWETNSLAMPKEPIRIPITIYIQFNGTNHQSLIGTLSSFESKRKRRNYHWIQNLRTIRMCIRSNDPMMARQG